VLNVSDLCHHPPFIAVGGLLPQGAAGFHPPVASG
jgi:hypothetical protein